MLLIRKIREITAAARPQAHYRSSFWSGKIVAMPYLIDGHNLIPKLGLRLDSPDDEMELVGILQEFSRLSRRESQVYFDGAPVGEARTQRFGKVTAHFVRLGSTADAAIKNELDRLGHAARNWTIVTSDREVQSAARAAHAVVLSSEEFARQLGQLQQSPKRSSGDEPLSPDEILEWLKLFGRRK
jgi:predicted RNA-binding protein with PIN domain